MDLSIIIVNWESREYLRKCIGSILAGTGGIDFEIVVIDNASYDGSREMLRECHPRVRFFQSETNLGFAKANNAAYRESRGRNLLFLNPDIEIIGSAVHVLLESLERLPGAGAVGGRLLNEDGTVQSSCIQAFPTILNQALDSEILRALWPKSPLWGIAPLFEGKNGPREVDAVSGACIMMKRSVFEEVDGFCEDYFMYAEDIDLCYKLRRRGYRNFYIPDGTAIHFGGGSSRNGGSTSLMFTMQDSISKYFRKTHGNFYAMCYRAVMLSSAIFRIALLAGAFPFAYSRRRGTPWKASFRKWGAIFHWCVSPKASAGNCVTGMRATSRSGAGR
jgi:GT2 family glycosyltransferase